MKLKKFLSLVLCVTMVLSTMSSVVLADAVESVTTTYKVGEGYKYDNLNDALTANNGASNAIYEIYGEVKVEIPGTHGDFDFAGATVIGKTEVAKITVVGSGVADITNINMQDVKFSDEGTYNPTAADFMYQNFSGSSTFTNVEFLDGIRFCNSYVGTEAVVTVTECSFNEDSENEYSLWIDGGDITITESTIEGARGVKLGDARYKADNLKLKVSGCKFKGIYKKPAFVISNVDSESIVAIEDAVLTNCEYGLLVNEIANYEGVSVDGKTPAYVASVNGKKCTDITYAEAEAVDDGVELAKYVAEANGTRYLTLADALSAVDNADITIIAEGTYDIPALSNKTVKIIGGVDGVVIDHTIKNCQYHGCDITFEDVTIKAPNAANNYCGFNHIAAERYIECEITGEMFLYGDVSEFTDCTFVQESSGAYNVWTYGSKYVEFNECTFTSAGKSVLVYNEGGNGTELKVVDTDFIATTSVEGKAAIEIDSSLLSAEKGYSITIDGKTTATGFAAGSDSGSTLWNDKKVNDGRSGNTVVIVDDEVVHANVKNADEDTVVVAVVDGKAYTDMAAAIAAIKNDSTMTILAGTYSEKLDITETNVTVKGQGNVKFTTIPKLKGTNWYVEGIDFEYASSRNDINTSGTLKDCTFKSETDTLRYCYGKANSTLVIDGCTFNAGNLMRDWAIHFDDAANSDIVIKNSVFNGRFAIPRNVNSVLVSDTEITGYYANIWGAAEGISYENTTFDVNYIYVGEGDTVATFDDCKSVKEGESIMDLLYSDSYSATVIVDGKVETKDAKIVNDDGTIDYYKTLTDAVKAANGRTIDLMGKTVALEYIYGVGDATITNGTITMNPSVAALASTDAPYWVITGDVVFENVKLEGEEYNTKGWGIFYLAASNASVTFVDSEIDLKTDNGAGGLVKGDDVAGVTATFDGTDAYIENTGRVLVNLDTATLVNDSDFVIKGTEQRLENAVNRVGLVIKDTSSMEIDGAFEYGIKMDRDIKLYDDALLVVRNSGIADIMERENAGNPGLRVNDDAIVIADIITPEVWVITQGNGEVIEKSENIYVQFKKVDIDADKKDAVEGSDKYEIILTGYKHNINRLTTADLTFKLDAAPYANANMAYTIEPRAGITLTPHDADGYMFNFNGVTAPDETGENIVIGYVTISGYGNYSFSVAADNIEKGIKNIVNATEVQDSIVDTFVIDGATDKGTLIINTKIDNDNNMVGIIDDVEIKVPVKTLKVNVTFPNAVVEQNKAYQDMKVEITGTFDGAKTTRTYNLGEGEIAMNSDGAYVFEEENLVINESYTVTVSGAGYRTARYTVRMTDNKELKFWNNVMDEAQVIEIGNDSVVTVKNFLAGDIVKDNQINIYDLSAVVSYFGTSNKTNAKSDYAKYDLNRDGVIDSKDVAYVLVSWGE